MSKIKKGFVTGINGQDGSYLAEVLLEKGYEVHGLIRRTALYPESMKNIERIKDRITLHFGDIANEHHLCSLIAQIQPDEVYHLASQSDVRASFDIPEYTCDITGLGTLRLLEAIRNFSPNSRVYNAASSEMFGSALPPQNESTPMIPNSPYGCFPAKTKILTRKKNIKPRSNSLANESVNIEDIKIGDLVLSYDEKTGIKSFKKVLNIMSRKTRELHVIKFSNGNIIRCTEEHPIFIHNIGWVKAKDLIVGNEAIQYKYAGLSGRCRSLNNKGKLYDDMYGSIKSNIIRDKKSISLKGIPNKNKGKTFKEIYGLEKSKEISNKISAKMKLAWGNSDKLNRKEWSDRFKKTRKTFDTHNKGKTWEETYTSEKIDGLRQKLFGDNSPSKRKEVKDKISNSVVELWQDVGYIQNQLKARFARPNKKEAELQKLISMVTSDFEYNGGCELGIVINRKIPDFIHVNGKKKVIEFFGDYWHSLPWKEDTETTVFKYNEAGFDCLVIWEHELNTPEKVISKIKDFVYNPNTQVVSIISITKEIVNCNVYNLEVENNNNYFAYGILVHNCAKLLSFNLCNIYRRGYNMFICSGILYNHESPKRGKNFVTRKITSAVNEILRGERKELFLGNLDSKRDWGFSGDYVRAMRMMLQEEAPDDYVIGTGEAHTVREFVEEAFNLVGLDWKKYVKIDPDLYRPVEVNYLLADATKAHKKLGWYPTVTFKDLVKIMMEADKRG